MNSYQMVLHRPVELAPLFGKFDEWQRLAYAWCVANPSRMLDRHIDETSPGLSLTPSIASAPTAAAPVNLSDKDDENEADIWRRSRTGTTMTTPVM
jgi:hypothetical protein